MAGKDAACVTQLVQAGAIVLGKSVTTEFAGAHAGKTHNPHNLRHTPAGSSSGSAAAVADFMAPVGYGTQTAGSVIRPGAFNGVVAYKGTYGWADITGVKTYAKSLDTLGFFAREANDLALIRAAYGHAPADPPTAGAAHRLAAARRWWDHGRAATIRKNIEEAAQTPARGRRQGARMGDARELGRADRRRSNRVMTKEATHPLRPERKRFPHLFSPSLSQSLEVGDAVTPPAVCRRQEAQAARARPISPRPWERFDILLVPPAQRRGAGRPRQHRRSDLQPLLDLARHALHRAAVQHGAVRPAAVGAARSARMAATTSSSPGRAGSSSGCRESWA